MQFISVALEVIFTLVAVLSSAWLIIRLPQWNPHPDHWSNHGIILTAVFAWVPVWLVNFWLWHLIHPVYLSYPSMFLGSALIVLCLGFMGMILGGLNNLIRIIGAILAIVALWHTSWFWPNGTPVHTSTVRASVMSYQLIPVKTQDQCPDGLNVIWDPNQNTNLLSEGLDTVNPTHAVQQIEDNAQHDPRILQRYFNSTPLGLLHPLNDTNALSADGCYSSLGRDSYHNLLSQYKTKPTVSTVKPSSG